jgi:uncharacterized membrane protein
MLHNFQLQIKNNIIEIILFILLQIPLLIFGDLLNLWLFIFQVIAFQIWLGVLCFILYTMKYNIEKNLKIKE